MLPRGQEPAPQNHWQGAVQNIETKRWGPKVIFLIFHSLIQEMKDNSSRTFWCTQQSEQRQNRRHILSPEWSTRVAFRFFFSYIQLVTLPIDQQILFPDLQLISQPRELKIKSNLNKASNLQYIAQLKLFSDFCDGISLYWQNYIRSCEEKVWRTSNRQRTNSTMYRVKFYLTNYYDLIISESAFQSTYRHFERSQSCTLPFHVQFVTGLEAVLGTAIAAHANHPPLGFQARDCFDSYFNCTTPTFLCYIHLSYVIFLIKN